MSKITVEIRPPRFPNFLSTATNFEWAKDIKLPVSQLSDKEAGEVWDAWKAAWLEHVAKKRAAVRETPIHE